MLAALVGTRVVVISGARQPGKSTLARLVARGLPGAELRCFDEAAVRSAAQADSAWFVRHDGLLVLDEVQQVPDLLLLWPLSQGEIGRTTDGFVDAVFEHGATLAVAESPLRRSDYLERALRGGYLVF